MMMDILHRISQSDDPELFFWASHLNKVQSMLNAGFIVDTHDRASVVKNLIWLGLLTSRSVHTNIGRIQLLHVDSSTKILQRPVIDKIVRHEWLFHTPVDLELFVTIKWVDLPEDRPEDLSCCLTKLFVLQRSTFIANYILLDRWYVRARFPHVVLDVAK